MNYRSSSFVVSWSLCLLLLFQSRVQLVFGLCEGTWVVRGLKGHAQKAFPPCQVRAGPVRLVWQTTGNFQDDEYFIKLRKTNSPNDLYGNDKQYSKAANGHSKEVGGISGGSFRAIFACNIEGNKIHTGTCEGGEFEWKIVDCGCPPNWTERKACLYDSSRKFYDAKDAVCEAPPPPLYAFEYEIRNFRFSPINELKTEKRSTNKNGVIKNCASGVTTQHSFDMELDITNKQSITVSESFTSSSTHTVAAGVSVTVKAEVGALIAKGSVAATTTFDYSHTWGRLATEEESMTMENTTTIGFTLGSSIEVGPNTCAIYELSSQVSSEPMEIPYNATAILTVFDSDDAQVTDLETLQAIIKNASLPEYSEIKMWTISYPIEGTYSGHYVSESFSEISNCECGDPLPTTMPTPSATAASFPTVSTVPTISYSPAKRSCEHVQDCNQCLENNDGYVTCSWSRGTCQQGSCEENNESTSGSLSSPCYDIQNDGMSSTVMCQLYDLDKDYCKRFDHDTFDCSSCTDAALPSQKGNCSFFPLADTCLSYSREGSIQEKENCPATTAPSPTSRVTVPTQLGGGARGSSYGATSTNVLADATVTLDPRYQWHGDPSNVIFGNGDTDYHNFMEYPNTQGTHCLFRTEYAPWIQIDLGHPPKLIYGITIWHYWGDQRQHCSQGVQVSLDGENWDTIFDTGHEYGPVEKADGNHYDFEKPQAARYIRHFSGPSNLNNGVHFLKLEVNGVQISDTNNLIADIGTKVKEEIKEELMEVKEGLVEVKDELKEEMLDLIEGILQKIDDTCGVPTTTAPISSPTPVPAARRQLAGLRCKVGSQLKVQCGFKQDGSIVSEDRKSLFVEEGSRKINTGFFHKTTGACSDLVDVGISVVSNEVDERQSAFLTNVILNDEGGEVPRVYVAPRICKDERQEEEDPTADTICEPSPAGKRFYDIKITATDRANNDKTGQDICRVIVLPKTAQEGELRGGKADPLTKQEQRQLLEASTVRTVVGTLSLQCHSK